MLGILHRTSLHCKRNGGIFHHKVIFMVRSALLLTVPLLRAPLAVEPRHGLPMRYNGVCTRISHVHTGAAAHCRQH